MKYFFSFEFLEILFEGIQYYALSFCVKIFERNVRKNRENQNNNCWLTIKRSYLKFLTS